MGSQIGGGVSLVTVLVIFIVLWVYLGKRKRKQDEHLRKLRLNRKAQLEKLKAKKRAEQEASED